MDKIQDIHGYFADSDEIFHKEDQWYGRLLVNDDQTVEGIAENFYGDEHFFLHGTLSDKKVVINRFSVNGSSKNADKYFGTKLNSRYYGTCFATDSFVEIPIGDCKLLIKSAESTREITDFEVSHLERRIQDMKAKLSDEQQQIYQSILDGEHDKLVERSAQKVFLTK